MRERRKRKKIHRVRERGKERENSVQKRKERVGLTREDVEIIKKNIIKRLFKENSVYNR